MIVTGERKYVEALDIAAYKRFCRQIGVDEDVVRRLHIRFIPKIELSLLDLAFPEMTTRGQCDPDGFQIDIATDPIEKEFRTERQRLAEAQSLLIHETLHLTESELLEVLWVAPWGVAIVVLFIGLIALSARIFSRFPVRVRVIPGVVVGCVCFIGLLRPIYLLNPNEQRARKPVVPVVPFMKRGVWQ